VCNGVVSGFDRYIVEEELNVIVLVGFSVVSLRVNSLLAVILS
jgi:hypothetical protein